MNGGTIRSPSSPICGTDSSNDANANTDCEGNALHNETSVTVNPTNPLNMIGSANDYPLSLSAGLTVYETVCSRAQVTFYGGMTSTTYPIKFGIYTFTGDPAVAFDADGTAYIATFGFLWSQNIGCCANPDIGVSHSTDGGQTWSKPVRVVSAFRPDSSLQLRNPAVDRDSVSPYNINNGSDSQPICGLFPSGSRSSAPAVRLPAAENRLLRIGGY